MADIPIDDARWLCTEFGVKTKARTRDALLEALIDKGVTFDMMQDALSRKEEELPAFTKRDPVVLVRMNRLNPTYRFRKYTFTKDHPFALMTEDDASAILTMESGFTKATVEEAESYYGRRR